MNNIKLFGKFLDQPILISNLDKAMPKIMTAATAGKIAYDCFQTAKQCKNKSNEEKEKLKKNLFKKSLIMVFSVASAVCAPKIAGKITNRQPIEKLDKVKETAKKNIDEFVSGKNFDKNTTDILDKAKEKVLSFREVKTLYNNLEHTNGGSEFLNKLLPEPENVNSKDIFSEIGYLSLYGAVPVAGGIAGGVAADIISKDDWKKSLPDKLCEGIYQYLANIFMCNVGAGAALAIMEKANITSKAARAAGMAAGIILTGVLGGSKIANLITKKIVNPIVCPKCEIKERKPEPLDMFMHTDDIATVAVLSGLKWIEPSLPVLYSISAYRSGSGYRN